MQEADRITCIVSGKVRKNRPEERVRQQVLRRLLAAPYCYDKGDIDVELLVEMGSDDRWADIAIFRRGEPHTQQRAYIIIECKRADTSEQKLRGAAGQLQSYLSASANALWGVTTNGSLWIVVRKEKVADGTIVYSAHGDIPPASAPRAPYTRAGDVPPWTPPAVALAPADDHLQPEASASPVPRAQGAPRRGLYVSHLVPTAVVVAALGLLGARAFDAGANDGTNASRPTLAPDDAGFVDARGGWGWGDRCWKHIHEGRYGWAKAECANGLAMGGWSPSPRPSLLYNLGLIEKAMGKNEDARRLFQQSLALREHPEVRAALNALPSNR